MADFARVLAAVDEVLHTNGTARYREKQGSMATESLTGNPFTIALTKRITVQFEGTSTELLEWLTPLDDDRWRAPKGWPANAREVTQQLRRWAPVLRKAGWTVDDDSGANHSNVLRWTITPPGAT